MVIPPGAKKISKACRLYKGHIINIENCTIGRSGGHAIEGSRTHRGPLQYIKFFEDTGKILYTWPVGAVDFNRRQWSMTTHLLLNIQYPDLLPIDLDVLQEFGLVVSDE